MINTNTLKAKMKHSKPQTDSRNTSTSITNPEEESAERREKERDFVKVVLAGQEQEKRRKSESKKNLLNPPKDNEFKSPSKGPGSSLSDDVYNNVCKQLIEGRSLTDVAHQNSIARSTVDCIKETIRSQIPTWKQRNSAKLGDLISELIDSLHQDLREGRLSADKKSITIGILADKKEKLDGDHTVIEHRTVSSGEDFSRRMAEYLGSLPSANTQEINDLAQIPGNAGVYEVPATDCTENAQVSSDSGGGGDIEGFGSESPETDSPSQKNFSKKAPL